MGKDENLRKIYENQMKPMNYTWNLHLKRHEFYTEPVIRLAGELEKER
ncbi:hypothetical protein DET54_107226 [Paenibacillus pabuli]|uniref:Uncharacterized protein n=1 Tax=Paenibacillus pabuli TaxID=1472 RepID=A0A855XZN0_9BACL|nr:hypothetical protein DET56_104217 [Paenibacillus pabuli]PXW07548.1 hypothetical protein DEU73_105216 [Paenibacillus taichungensis]RAI94689.1 hypothetical protein DET54_107226 [Paenibacillus pabuli]